MIHTLTRTITLAIPINVAWDFFRDPSNLPTITPPELGFKITSDLSTEMYAGMIITYRVHPFLGIPIPWVTEITQVTAPYFFIDEQRYGPYRMWHHQHHFRSVPGGTEIRDTVDYILPGGPIGLLVHHFFVRKKLQWIFEYRAKVLAQRFGLLAESNSFEIEPASKQGTNS